MNYAKLISGHPQFAPRKMPVGDDVVYNPTGEMLEAAGYLPVIETEPPEVEDGFYAAPHWAEVDGSIVQSWTVEELPEEDASAEDYEAALAELGVDLHEED